MNVLDEAIRAHRAGDLAAAVRGYRQALPAKPVEAAFNLGVAYYDLGEWDDAEAAYRAALSGDPNLIFAQLNLAHVLLSRGAYAEGWEFYEARRTVPGGTTLDPNRFVSLPEWLGESLAGKHILVFGEQGYGDQIMFARFLPLLERAAAKVTYLCSPPLSSLIPGSSPTVSGASPADCWVLVGSLPLRLGTAGAIPPPLKISQGYAEKRSGIGVIASGSRAHGNDSHRSLPASAVRRLLSIPGARSLLPEDTGAKTFRETAEIVAGLQLVITVDTAGAHLAGSMGVPTWIMVPQAATDWRWGRRGMETPWYPSARLFRQTERGDWSAVLDQVEAMAESMGRQASA